MRVFHGGKDLDKTYRFGFNPSAKKGRSLYGIGLYTSTDPQDCENYAKGGRKIFELEIELDASKISNAVLIDYATAYHFIRGTCSKKFLKDFEKAYQVQKETGEKFSLHRLHVFFCNYHPRLHLVSKELNDFMAANGAAYSIEKLSSHFGQCVMIHDFDIIKKVQNYNYDNIVSVLPDDVLKLKSKW
jgi:hypothetical protein